METRILKKWLLRFWPVIALAVILGIAAYLRLYRIDKYLTFLGDEGRDVLIVKRMIVDHKWTLLGPTASVGGFFMGPVYYYFMLPFLWLWHLDPVGPAVGVALVGIATVYLVYLLGTSMFDRRVGLVSAALYAVSPVVIAYSRSSWNPNIVPFFSTILIYILWHIRVTGKWKELFWAGVILGIGIQLHYAFLFLFGFVGVWLIAFGKPWNRFREYGLGVLGFILGFSPFLGFELRHGFTNTRAIFEFVFASKETGFAQMSFFSNIMDVLFRVFSRLLLRFPDTRMFEALTGIQQQAWTAVSWAFIAFVLLSALFLWRNAKALFAVFPHAGSGKERDSIRYAIILMFLWLFTVLLFFGIYKKSIYDYYFGIFFAVPFLFTGLALTKVSSFGSIGRWIAALSVTALLFWNWQGRPFQFQPNDQLGQTKKISQAVLDHTGGKPFNFALLTGGNSDHAYRYFFEIWGHPPVVIENNAVDPERKTVTDQLLVVCEYPDCVPLGNSLWEIAGFGRAEVVGSWDVSVVKVYKLVHYTGS